MALETYDRIIAMQPKTGEFFDGTSLDYAKRFTPGSRTVIIAYTKIPGYRGGRNKPSYGFAISDNSATDTWYNQYTCGRKSAKRVFAELKENAEERGFVVVLEIDPESGYGL